MSIWIPPDSDFALALREPNLLVPGKKPEKSAVEIRYGLFDDPRLKIVKALVYPGHDSVSKETLGGTWSASGDKTVVGNTTCAFPTGATLSSRNAIVLAKFRALAVSNYQPTIRFGTAWAGNLVAHSEAGGELYAGYTASARLEPSDTSGAFVGPSYDTELVMWSGGHTSGVSFGVRYWINRAFNSHKSIAAAYTLNLSQGALTIEGGSTGIEVDYVVLVDIEGEYLYNTPNDEAAKDVIRRFYESPYKALFKPANDTPYLFPVAGGGGVSGTGALSSSTSAVSGTGTVTRTGTGALSSQASAIAGTGTVSGAVTGAGDISSQTSAIAGAGSVARVGTGALSAQASAISATGAISKTGTGALESQVSAVTGTGTVSAAGTHTGTGAIAAQVSVVAGTGAVTRTATGALIAQSAIVVGAGSVTRVGTGVLSSQVAAVAGTGAVTTPSVITGTGSLECSSASIDGYDTQQIWTEIPSVSTVWTEV